MVGESYILYVISSPICTMDILLKHSWPLPLRFFEGQYVADVREKEKISICKLAHTTSSSDQHLYKIITILVDDFNPKGPS